MALWAKKPNQAEPQMSRASAAEGNDLTSANATPGSVSSSQQAASSRPELSTEQKRMAAQASRRLSGAFGQIVTLLMGSDAYKRFMLSDLEWFITPALTSGQFSLAEAQSTAYGLVAPIGVVLWAQVSPEVDARLTSSDQQLVRLKPHEWKSGEILWIVDAIGDRRVINVMLSRLAENEWKGRQVKLKAREKDGRLGVAALQVNPTVAKGP